MQISEQAFALKFSSNLCIIYENYVQFFKTIYGEKIKIPEGVAMRLKYAT